MRTDEHRTPVFVTGYNLGQKRTERTVLDNYLLNYPRTDCPRCRRPMEPGVNFFRDLDSLRCIQGKYCSQCDLFVTRDRSLAGLISPRRKAEGYVLHEEYWIPSWEMWEKVLQAIPSALAALHLKSLKDGSIYSLILVRAPVDAMPEKHVFYYGDPSVRNLIWNFKNRDFYTRLWDHPYEIIKTDFRDREHPERATDYVLDRIRLKTGGGTDDALILGNGAEALIYAASTGRLESVQASVNEEGTYYLDLSVYEKFVAAYGNPGLHISAGQYGREDAFDYRRSETILAAYGYTVSQNSRHSEEYRRILLREILDLGLLSREEAAAILKYHIDSHKAPRYAHAVMCWKKDLEFVKQYRARPERYEKPGMYEPRRYNPRE